jgi:hypothetical protein
MKVLCVIPAYAGIQRNSLDTGFRRDDGSNFRYITAHMNEGPNSNRHSRVLLAGIQVFRGVLDPGFHMGQF